MTLPMVDPAQLPTTNPGLTLLVTTKGGDGLIIFAGGELMDDVCFETLRRRLTLALMTEPTDPLPAESFGGAMVDQSLLTGNIAGLTYTVKTGHKLVMGAPDGHREMIGFVFDVITAVTPRLIHPCLIEVRLAD